MMTLLFTLGRYIAHEILLSRYVSHQAIDVVSCSIPIIEYQSTIRWIDLPMFF